MQPDKQDQLKKAQEFLRSVAGKESYAHLQAVDEDLSADEGDLGDIHPCVGDACAKENPEAYRCRYHYFG